MLVDFKRENKIDYTYVIQGMFEDVMSGRTVSIPMDIMDRIQWHNPLKGETHNGEIERWRTFIRTVYGIYSAFDIQSNSNSYLFKQELK